MEPNRHVIEYGIRDVLDYRSITWTESDEFLFLTQIPSKIEPFFAKPNYYCIGMISQGSLEININHQFYKLSPNTLMMYRPGQIFRAIRIAENTAGTFILFTRKFMDYLNENIFSVKYRSFLSEGMPSIAELAPQEKARISFLFREIFALLNHLSKPNWELVARSLTSALLFETDHVLATSAGSPDQVADAGNDLYSRFTSLVHAHFKTNRQLNFYASKLGISHRELYLEMKKTRHGKPTSIISHRVVSEARVLLLHTKKTIGEIAYDLNFSDPFAFSKYFKKHTGLSPKQYRSQSVSVAYR